MWLYSQSLILHHTPICTCLCPPIGPVLRQQGQLPEGLAHRADADQGVGSAVSAFSIPKEAASALDHSRGSMGT